MASKNHGNWGKQRYLEGVRARFDVYAKKHVRAWERVWAIMGGAFVIVTVLLTIPDDILVFGIALKWWLSLATIGAMMIVSGLLLGGARMRGAIEIVWPRQGVRAGSPTLSPHGVGAKRRLWLPLLVPVVAVIIGFLHMIISPTVSSGLAAPIPADVLATLPKPLSGFSTGIATGHVCATRLQLLAA